MTSNQHFGSNPIPDTFSLWAQTKDQAKKITDRAVMVVKGNYKDPQDLANYIEQYETPVHVLKMGIPGKMLLMSLGFEPGFIAPPAGDNPLYAKRYRTLLKMLSVTSDCPKGIFVVPKELFTVGFLAHQLHHWMSCMSDQPGYDETAITLYKQFWNKHNGSVEPVLDKLNEHEIKSLRAAIQRDIEALQFIKKMSEELFHPVKRFSEGRNLA